VWISAGVFSEIRLLQKFEPGQIWALYSDIDKFPNCYAFIEKVDLENNEVHAKWLELCPDGEMEERLVIDRTVGCGTYRVSTTHGIMIYTDTKPFSHPVHAIFTGRRNSYEIYPRKGEVWALLRGWDIGWSPDAHNQKNYKYEVVQVLSDFTTGTSIIVMPLVKIKVFVSLFMQSEVATPYLIPQDDTIWFSHYIPYRLMGATESKGIQEGALELDPAALPVNLEQPLTCLVSESMSVRGSEFDAKYAGSSGGNKSHKESKGAGERQHGTCMNGGIFAKAPVVENGEHYTPSAVEGTDVDEESDDAGVEVLCTDFFNFDQLRDVSQFRPNQIWAVYDTQSFMPRFYARITKGWDIGWSSDADKHTDFEYEIVQVVSDFTTSTSIIVMLLVKIEGFVSLFKQSKEATPLVIPQDHTLMFSHCVPHHSVRGTEREGIPEGALELDPAALPPNMKRLLLLLFQKADQWKVRTLAPNTIIML
uniref:DUF3444 domain-containing protein n=1 Tax=Aegilops tauschii subsp. strangulata TaxID=200361 RepID=A0A453AIL5_AEGTS